MHLARKFPPSEPCACPVCVGYCARPGWWTVREAGMALNAGFGARMMLEIAPDRAFGVLSPAFKGCEGHLGLQKFSTAGCTFFLDERCELFASGFQPLECRFCHHDRPGQGKACHAAIEKDWDSPAGHTLVARWTRLRGIGPLLTFYGLDHLRH
jgi:hypothetical protein